MPAVRPRTVFAASFVMTVVACGKKEAGGGGGGGSGGSGGERSAFATTWSVSKGRVSGDPEQWCHGVSYAPCPEGATCNPPAPTPMPCPPGFAEKGYATVAQKSATECVLVPDGCQDLTCATQKVRCPWSYQELGVVLRRGKRDPTGLCTVTWLPEEYVTGQFVVPCPGDGITAFAITRADLDKPCVLSAAGISSREIPCPAEPAQFANAAALKAAFASNKTALVGKRVQVTATRGTAAEVGCGKRPSEDVIRVAVDGQVTAAGTLQDCAIWDY